MTEVSKTNTARAKRASVKPLERPKTKEEEEQEREKELLRRELADA